MTSRSAHKGTQMYVPTPTEGARSHARPKSTDGECPKCGSPTGEHPFCLRDGTLMRGSFPVGERYLVEELLGVGGSALVFGARHRVLEKPVALKIPRHEHASEPEQAQRFFREARNASQLQHPNIVGVQDFGDDEELDLRYLVMDRVRGPTLAQAMTSGPMPWPRVLSILSQAARALAYAHERGLLHRDLNPRNIMLEQSSGRDDLVKLCDFGLSRLIEGDERVTVSGQMVGTPAYMPPEQIRGDEAQDCRVDLYALGATAYEMLSGQLPHQGATPVALLANKLHEPADPLRARMPDTDLPQALEEAIMRCLATDPGDRPSSGEELEQILEGVRVDGSSSHPAATNIIGGKAGSYRILEEVGTGGIGTVYRGEHPVIGTEVAIKVLHAEVANSSDVVDRFIQEAKSASAIGNPHIPRYFDFGRFEDGRPYAVLEYYHGETLEDRLRQRGAMTLAQAVPILRQLANALADAHDADIIHRDLKPENLFLAQDREDQETVKVLDFGIAKARSPGANPARTQAGLFMGTPWYCAPEQAMGAEVGPTADVYAFGVTAYEMLTGRLPFEGEVQDVFSQKAHLDPPSVRTHRPDLPAEVDRTLQRMLARDPSQRIQDMHEVIRELDGWEQAAPASAETAPVEQDASTAVDGLPVRRRRGAVVTAAVAVVLAVGAGAYALSGDDGNDRGAQPAAAEPVEGEPSESAPAATAEEPSELESGLSPDSVPELETGEEDEATAELETEADNEPDEARRQPGQAREPHRRAGASRASGESNDRPGLARSADGDDTRRAAAERGSGGRNDSRSDQDEGGDSKPEIADPFADIADPFE